MTARLTDRAIPGILGPVFIAVCTAGLFPTPARSADRPNIVVLLMDDVGYGDLTSYGHPLNETPNMDRLAAEGMRMTSFVTGSWCVPSRTQLITGRYMPRVRFGGGTGADGRGGLPDSELTLAESLKAAGYRTHMLGKWHLGYKEKKFLPVNQGFDTWYGLPYSNDYRKPWVQTDEPLGMYEGTEMVEHPIDQDTLTTRYTERAVRLLGEQSADQPFFLYVAYAMAHLPLHTTDEFRGTSQAGLYGDVMATLDWSVGRILETLEAQGLEENTIVFLASDNGPWLELPKRMLHEGNLPWHAGSKGLLNGHKGTTYEGGPRVPAMIRWPGRIPAGQVSPQLMAMPDIYATLIKAAGGRLPDHAIDGHDLMPFLTGRAKQSPRKDYYYFLGSLQALREGDWKLRTVGKSPELFNLRLDPAEQYNRAAEFPGRVAAMREKMKTFAKEVGVKVAGAPKA